MCDAHNCLRTNYTSMKKQEEEEKKMCTRSRRNEWQNAYILSLQNCCSTDCECSKDDDNNDDDDDDDDHGNEERNGTEEWKRDAKVAERWLCGSTKTGCID